MAPSRCKTLLRCSPCASVQSLGHSPASVPLSHCTSSMTTEELLAKIVRVMDVVEKDMKQWHSAKQAQALAEHKCSGLQSSVSTAICNKPMRVFLTVDLITVIGTLVPQDFPENNPPPSDEGIWADIFYVKTNE
ncbi:hypothetical protein EDC04DRAFT_2608945 [Pisolithus marmoratus]|nr:hypothetical protein EDC04DRAFT_2608945 [Pisolithus marmoratus]